MIEFALVFLLLLILVVGALEGARAIWTYITLAHAARDGVRYAMVRGGDDPVSTDDLEDYLLSKSPGLDSASLDTELVWDPDSTVGGAVEVRLSYSFQFVASPLFLAQSDLTLFTSSRMLIAN
jgi:Flp pilus assembly protein TadG